MKKTIILTWLMMITMTISAQKFSPYIMVGTSNVDIKMAKNQIVTALKDNGFQILGGYYPAQNSHLQVIVFTRGDLKNAVLRSKDRGALAAAQKIGLKQKNGQVYVSYTNPEYIARAYLGGHYSQVKSVVDKFHKDLKTALSDYGQNFKAFGGTIKADKLKHYHYKIFMPYFTDPTLLNEYASYDEGYQTIINNLKNHKGQTSLVYKLVYPNKKIAVFGIALRGNDSGSEKYFLPKIGTDNLAAMPYEIILQDNKATMLPGKYRLAVSWPNLSMGTFMKIVSTPGHIEDKLKAVTKK